MGTLVFLVNRIRNRFRRAVIWLLIVLIPVQASGLASAELRGPAHFHDHSLVEVELRDQDHSHSAIERHHHGAADEPIFVDDGSDHQHDALAIDEGVSGYCSLFSYAALLERNLGCPIIDLCHVRPGGAQKALSDRSVGRIERPPATDSD